MFRGSCDRLVKTHWSLITNGMSYFFSGQRGPSSGNSASLSEQMLLGLKDDTHSFPPPNHITPGLKSPSLCIFISQTPRLKCPSPNLRRRKDSDPGQVHTIKTLLLHLYHNFWQSPEVPEYWA